MHYCRMSNPRDLVPLYRLVKHFYVIQLPRGRSDRISNPTADCIQGNSFLTKGIQKVKEELLIDCISDTHGYEPKLPGGDILLHTGDFSQGRGSLQETIKFLQWLDVQPYKRKILVAGNHDFICERDPGLFQTLVNRQKSIIYLMDSGTNIDGLSIYGAPWQPWFHNWAFNLPRDGEQLKRKWEMIPDETDILLTHGPPFGVRDQCAGGLAGCKHLRDEVDNRVKPMLHVFGHIHEGAGFVMAGENSKYDRAFINASCLDQCYTPLERKVTRVSLEKKGSKWVPGGNGISWLQHS